MSTTHQFNSASSAPDVRYTFTQGLDEVKNYFSLEQGLSETEETALALAEKAELTARLADKGRDFAERYDEVVKKYEAIGTGPEASERFKAEEYGLKSYDHADFKALFKDEGPVILDKAHGTMMAAQLYVNNETVAIEEGIYLSGFAGRPMSMGVEPADGFKQAAAENYKKAAEMMAQAGRDDVAEAMRISATDIEMEITSDEPLPPHKTVSNIAGSTRMGLQAANSILNGDYYHVSDEANALWDKLEDLTKPDNNVDGPKQKPQAPSV